MTATSQAFLKAIELTPTEPEFFDDAFIATPQYVPWPKAYGGDIVAQATAAAIRSMADGKTMNSMHSYFMRPANILEPVRYEVERLRDGRSYSTRQVRGFQDGKAIFAAFASFHAAEPGEEFAVSAPAGLPNPEDLPSTADVLAGVAGPAAEYWSSGRSFDLRHVPSPLYLRASGDQVPHQAVWVKAFDRLPDDPELHRVALAYVCDYTILEPLLRNQALAWADAGLVTASLDHSIWFHRDGRMDDWVLYAQEAISTQRSRGLALGKFYSRAGELLATVAQEGMIRPGS